MNSEIPELLFASFEKNVSPKNTNIDVIVKTFMELVGKDIKDGERVLLKTHFGQWGNVAYFRPAILRAIVDAVKSQGGYPTLAETAGLGYGLTGKYGGRSTASDYLRMAASHGFTIGTMGAPIVIIDGELGVDTFTVPIEGDYIDRVEVALHFDKIVMITHAKG